MIVLWLALAYLAGGATVAALAVVAGRLVEHGSRLGDR